MILSSYFLLRSTVVYFLVRDWLRPVRTLGLNSTEIEFYFKSIWNNINQNNTIERLIHYADTTIKSQWLLRRYSRCCCLNGRAYRCHDWNGIIMCTRWTTHSLSRQTNVQLVYSSQAISKNESNERTSERKRTKRTTGKSDEKIRSK